MYISAVCLKVVNTTMERGILHNFALWKNAWYNDSEKEDLIWIEHTCTLIYHVKAIHMKPMDWSLIYLFIFIYQYVYHGWTGYKNCIINKKSTFVIKSAVAGTRAVPFTENFIVQFFVSSLGDLQHWLKILHLDHKRDKDHEFIILWILSWRANSLVKTTPAGLIPLFGSPGEVLGHVRGVDTCRRRPTQGLRHGADVTGTVTTTQPHVQDAQFLQLFGKTADVTAGTQPGIQVYRERLLTWNSFPLQVEVDKLNQT